jgi:prepilin-type N-terminal cleavage/methylation domain-containing protein
MRPTGKRWLGPKQQVADISGRERIAKRCERIGRYGVSPDLEGRAKSSHRFGISPKSCFRVAGLSLIELLVVLTIIAAISALITTSILSALNKQNQRICMNNMLTIEAAKDEYIRDHPGATTIPDGPSFQQYFRFGIPRCPDGGNYENLLSLTQTVNCSVHGSIPVSPTPTP